MKKYCTFTAALLCVFLLFSVACFVNAAEAQGTHQSEAINNLKEQKIVLGDEYGNVMETSPITREQMTALIGRILAFSDARQTGLEIYFTDTDEISDWAYPHILSGVEMGYIDGYPDKTFKPGQQMTYEEAVKFALCAFMQATDTNSAEYIKTHYLYPDGILALAKESGYLYGVNGTIGSPIARGDVITLLYNVSRVMITKQTTTEATPTASPEISEPEPEPTPEPTASPAATPSPSDEMSLSYEEAEKIAEDSLSKLLQEESAEVAADTALQGSRTPELHNNRMAYKFQYYSKTLQTEGIEGILGNIYVYDDGSTGNETKKLSKEEII